MSPRTAWLRSPALLAACDAAAIVVFVTIGLISHRRGLSASGYARDTLPLAAGWFGAAALFHPYASRGVRRVLATWAVGIPAGVLVRALVLGRTLNGSEAAFLAVCLATIGLLVLTLRSALRLAGGTGRPT
jgi:hypothetical protein